MNKVAESLNELFKIIEGRAPDKCYDMNWWPNLYDRHAYVWIREHDRLVVIVKQESYLLVRSYGRGWKRFFYRTIMKVPYNCGSYYMDEYRAILALLRRRKEWFKRMSSKRSAEKKEQRAVRSINLKYLKDGQDD